MKINLEELKTEVKTELKDLELKAYTLFCKDTLSKAQSTIDNCQNALDKAKLEYDSITEDTLNKEFTKDSGIGLQSVAQLYKDKVSGKKRVGL